MQIMTKMTTGAMFVLENNPKQVVLIAPPNSRRVDAFQQALQDIDWPIAKIISFHDIVKHPNLLIDCIQQGDIVRLETSGECSDTERLLLQLGESVVANNLVIDNLQLEQGEIIPSNQWYAGLSLFFRHLQQILQQAQPHYHMFDVNEGLVFFDKRKTSIHWQQQGLPTPEIITNHIESFEQLIDTLTKQKISRVFIKLAHGSAASGTMALSVTDKKTHAVTTIELLQQAGQIHFYNTRRLKQYTDRHTIAMMFNQLLKHHDLQIEAWIPKASYQGKIFDVRVVVINGQAQHTLIRLGKRAMTNLHLENGRGDLEQVKTYLGNHWAAIPKLAEQAMLDFPNSLYAGLDVLVTPHQHKAYLLEANTFGDFHPNTYWQGLNTYQAELLALLKRNKLIDD